MYCPKCKSEYIDGRSRCKKCNVKLVVKLPKEKIIKKKIHKINLEKLKYKKRIQMLIGSFFITTAIGSILFLFGFYLYEKLGGFQNAILLREITLNLTILNMAIFTSIGLYFGVDIWNDGKKLNLDSKLLRRVVKGVIPIVIISFAVYMLMPPILDYMNKDFQTIQGKVTDINHSKGYDDLYVDGKDFFFNESLFIKVEKGKSYTFIYAKRSKIILNIK